MWSKRKITVFALVTVALTAGAGIAFAAWSAIGTGAGTATATGAVEVTVNATSGAADLYPGFDAGDLYFTLTNPNPYPVTFTSMALGLDGIVSSDEVNCPAVNVTAVPATGLSLVVDANSTSGTLSIADVVTLDEAAPDGCQGVSFDISVVLSGAQSPVTV